MTPWSSLLILLSIACRPDPPTDWQTKYAVHESVRHRSAILEAIRQTNLVTEAGDPKLAAGWESSSLRAITVHCVSADWMGSTLPMVVAPDRKAILVNSQGIDALLSRFTAGGGWHVEIEATALLTFALMHEVAHIAHDDEINERLMPAIEVEDLARPDTITHPEWRADMFVANRIKRATRVPSDDPDRFIDGNMLALQLTKMSFALFGKRMQDHFGAEATTLKRVMGDPGYTHLNIELRLLILMQNVFPTDAGMEYLQMYFKMRKGEPPA